MSLGYYVNVGEHYITSCNSVSIVSAVLSV